MTDDLLLELEEAMEAALVALSRRLARVRTGRAAPNLLDGIMVSYYGTDTPIDQVANIAVDDARTLSVTPWEKDLLPTVTNAIQQSSLGLNPVASSAKVLVPVPQLTEERREEMRKMSRNHTEQARVSVRNARRTCNSSLAELEKSGEISKDELARANDQVQKLTDSYIEKANQELSKKEKELSA